VNLIDVNQQADGFSQHPPAPRGSFAALPLPLRAVGYLMVLLGYFGIVCKPTTLVQLFPDFVKRLNPAWSESLAADDATLLIVRVCVGTPISIIALVGGLGMLWMRKWSRKVVIAYAVLAILATLVFGAIAYRQLAPAVDQYVTSSTQPVDRDQFYYAQLARLVMSVAGQLILPVGILGVMTSPRARRYFS
jgi:cytochrome c oxidase assembly factor CtaG